MSDPILMYIISNGDLAREALNSVAILLGSKTFDTAMKIGVLFSIYGAVVNYIRGHDFVTFGKWFITYFSIATIMLGPKVTLQIIDISNPGANYTVANVPYGLGYPASVITSTAHGIIQAFEGAFHTPDDLSYNKTGMLFGSKLFRISSEFNVVNPEIKSELNEYVKNCVLGDILISKKYSMADLTESPNLLDTITKNPSNIRGIYMGGVFKTCQAVTTDLKTHLETDIKDNILKSLGKRIFGTASKKSGNAESLLENAYHHFNYGSLSSTASEIATQNILINGIRDGLLNYTAETGATAALLNLSTTQAMDKMRMTLATSRNVALYTIPIIHTILLILMLSLFPIIVLVALQPNLTVTVLKNYLYTLVWIESWPLMFSCLNMVVTFYAKELGPGGLTMSNIDRLLLEHSDIANMAGYLMLSIPFISGGLVKGMSLAFNHAASYIGGVLQSSSSSAASEAASGNIHLGNSSWNNVNANKFDTNSTLMRGMATEQLKSGVLRTTRPGGEATYDSSQAISRLPVNIRGSEMLSASLSEQAEAARTATIQDQRSYDQSTSHAVTELDSLGKSLGSSKSTGEGFSSRKAASAAQSSSNMKNLATTIADRNHVDVNEAFKGLVNFSQGGTFNIGGSISGKALGINVGDAKLGLDGKLSTEHTRSHESSTQHGIGRSIDITAEEANRFSNDLHKVEEYSKTAHAETSKSEAASHLSQLSTDLRNSRASSEQYSAHKAESERLSNAASYVRQNSGQIDADFSQEFADYMVKTQGREKAERLFAGKNQAELISYAKEFVGNSGMESNIMSTYQQGSAGINPNQKYRSGYAGVDAKATAINTGHIENKQKILEGVKAQGVGVDQKQFDQITNKVENKQNEFGDSLKKTEEKQNNKYSAMQGKILKDIKDGAEKSSSWAYNMKNSIKPDFAKDKEEKKKES